MIDKNLRTVGRCIESMYANWTNAISDDVLSDIEVDLEHALAAVRDFRRAEQARCEPRLSFYNNGND